MKEYNKKYFASHYVPKPPREKKVKTPKTPKVPKEPKPPKEKKPKKNTKEPITMRMETGNFVLSFFD
jgi:hypothetical protein